MSATLQLTSPEVSPVALDNIPDKNSPEYRTYYYQRFREACYQQLDLLHSVDPESQITKYWRSIDEIKQEALADRMMIGIAFRPDANLDDADAVDGAAFAIAFEIINQVIRPRRTKKERSKAANGGNSLLRRAIARSAILSNPQTGLPISGY
ncbi:hypothetical protein BDZ97DRAFT_1756418 [Flammula alnicola]|nr:hypothetical protein BDZ97DRAFT_1756418 [Flammula alnicola]